MITLDGDYRLEDFGIRGYQDHEHPATPEYRHRTMSIPGMSGRWDFGTELGSKPFNLYFKSIGKDRIGLQQKLNEFIAFLHDAHGSPRIIKVSFDYEPDKHYYIKVNEPITPERLMESNNYPVGFVANDPYKYSNTFADNVTWGSEIITFEYHYLLGHVNDFGGGAVKVTSPQTLDISVSGLAVQPIFEIEGNANNLTISANGYSFKLPNFSNTKWIIDFEKYLVYKNGQETMEEIREFYLMPGDNQIKIAGSNINIDLRVKYRDKYN